MSKEICIIGGIGDALALICLQEVMEDVGKIHWWTRGQPLFSKFAKKLLPDLEHEDIAVEVPNDRPCVFKGHLEHWGAKLPHDIEDRSIFRLSGRKLTFSSVPWKDKTIAKVGKFKLPDSYYVVHTSTPINNPTLRIMRDYRSEDYLNTYALLEEHGTTGVILNLADELPADCTSDRTIDLSGKTTLPEAMQIVMGCSGFIGIDSWMSIVASKHLPADKLTILSRNSQFSFDAPIYLAPHEKFPFVYDHIPGKWREKRT